ncbi:GIY-YIG nuclease family protein [Nonlabens marinus]|nr:GIY-YIG nuclease family protein [Nonlabens marinus]
MFTYIMAHIENRLFYVGVTNNIKQIVFDHKNATFETHTGHYNIKQLGLVRKARWTYRCDKA